MNIKAYIILGIVIITAIIVIIFTIKLYLKKKQELIAEGNRMQAKMAAERAEWQKTQHDTEEYLRLKQEEFLKKVKAFEEERKQQADLNNKTDREVIIDLHTKTVQLAKRVMEMHNDLDDVEKTLRGNVGKLENSVETSISKIKEYIDKNAPPEIDEFNIQMAIESAIETKLYDFETKLNSLESKLNDDVDNKLDSIESKIDEIHYKFNI